MNKRSLALLRRRLQPINSWYFFAAFVIFGTIAIWALRQNNFQSIRLRDEVLRADQSNGDVEGALNNLRAHMYAHMNAGLSSGSLQQPIQLKYRYERLLEAEKQRVADSNQRVYNDAQNYCERLHPESRSGGPRVPCIEEYVTSHGAAEQPVPDALYKYDFISPRWSPDLAGWSLLIAVVCLILFVVRFGLERWLSSQLRDA